MIDRSFKDTSKIFLDASKALAEKGFEVFPVYTITPEMECSCGNEGCTSPGKHPKVRWKAVATSDPDRLDELAQEFPDHNVAIATGERSGIVVLDVDTAGDKSGAESLRLLEELHGPLPETVKARTGSGGTHFYFRHPGYEVKNSAGKLGPGLDVRGDGGYVVAPPSLHVSGGRYEWYPGCSPAEVEVAAAPAWMTEAPKAAGKRSRVSRASRGLTSGKPIPEGERNDAMFRLACRLRGQGLGEAAILQELREQNAKLCVPPLDDDEVEGLVDSAMRYEPEADDLVTTDLGNAERFLYEHGDRFKFHPDRGVWLHYDGCVWNEDSAEPLQAAAKKTVRGMRAVAELATTEERRKAIANHAKRSESRAALSNMLKVAQDEAGVHVRPGDLDADPWLLNAPNGTIDLRTGTLKPHDPADLLTKRTAFAYDEHAECPRFEAFMLEVMDGDEELVAFVQRAVGYSATGLTTEQVLFFFFGDGANGKSVLVETLMRVFGTYAQKAPTEMIITKNFSSIPNDLARLAGARFVVAAEAPEGAALNEARVKDLTGNDTLVGRFLHNEFFEFVPTHTLIVYGNHKPTIRGTDEGIWRRLRCVPFDVAISEERRDPRLMEKLLAEGPGIIAWIVRGCLEWARKGLDTPEKVMRLSKEYRVEMDQTRRFVDEACEVGLGYQAEVRDLYRAYKNWCQESGETPVSKVELSKKLGEMGFVDRRTAKTRYRLGLRATGIAGGVAGGELKGLPFGDDGE